MIDGTLLKVDEKEPKSNMLAVNIIYKYVLDTATMRAKPVQVIMYSFLFQVQKVSLHVRIWIE